jgi:Zn-finger protein
MYNISKKLQLRSCSHRQDGYIFYTSCSLINKEETLNKILKLLYNCKKDCSLILALYLFTAHTLGQTVLKQEGHWMCQNCLTCWSKEMHKIQSLEPI